MSLKLKHSNTHYCVVEILSRLTPHCSDREIHFDQYSLKFFVKANQLGLARNLYDADELFEVPDLQLLFLHCT